jgi:cytochrome c-type biogenesis protein
MLDVSIGIAFFAGLVSFISPCVLPLVPAYISYLGGRVAYSVDGQVAGISRSGEATMTSRDFSARFGIFLHGAAFVMGFSLVFVLLGIITTAFIRQVGGQNVSSITNIISRLGGVLIIFFGLHFGGFLSSFFSKLRQVNTGWVAPTFVTVLALGGVIIAIWGFSGRLAIWLPAYANAPVWPDVLGLLLAAIWLLILFMGGAFTAPQRFLLKLTNTLDAALYADTRREMSSDNSRGLLGSMMMGIVFSAGWSPCIGTIYGSILTLSAQTGDVTRTAVQLSAYSLGLGVPFLISALALDAVQGLFRKINRRMRTIKMVSGLLLVLMGLLVASGEMTRITASLATGEFADFSVRLEECSMGAIQGELDTSLTDCLTAPQ